MLHEASPPPNMFSFISLLQPPIFPISAKNKLQETEMLPAAHVRGPRTK